MLDRIDYQRRWKEKLKWYSAADVRSPEDKDAPIVLLATTEKDGFDAASIRVQIEDALDT